MAGTIAPPPNIEIPCTLTTALPHVLDARCSDASSAQRPTENVRGLLRYEDNGFVYNDGTEWRDLINVQGFEEQLNTTETELAEVKSSIIDIETYVGMPNPFDASSFNVYGTLTMKIDILETSLSSLYNSFQSVGGAVTTVQTYVGMPNPFDASSFDENNSLTMKIDVLETSLSSVEDKVTNLEDTAILNNTNLKQVDDSMFHAYDAKFNDLRILRKIDLGDSSKVTIDSNTLQSYVDGRISEKAFRKLPDPFLEVEDHFLHVMEAQIHALNVATRLHLPSVDKVTFFSNGSGPTAVFTLEGYVDGKIATALDDYALKDDTYTKNDNVVEFSDQLFNVKNGKIHRFEAVHACHLGLEEGCTISVVTGNGDLYDSDSRPLNEVITYTIKDYINERLNDNLATSLDDYALKDDTYTKNTNVFEFSDQLFNVKKGRIHSFEAVNECQLGKESDITLLKAVTNDSNTVIFGPETVYETRTIREYVREIVAEEITGAINTAMNEMFIHNKDYTDAMEEKLNSRIASRATYDYLEDKRFIQGKDGTIKGYIKADNGDLAPL